MERSGTQSDVSDARKYVGAASSHLGRSCSQEGDPLRRASSEARVGAVATITVVLAETVKFKGPLPVSMPKFVELHGGAPESGTPI